MGIYADKQPASEQGKSYDAPEPSEVASFLVVVEIVEIGTRVTVLRRRGAISRDGNQVLDVIATEHRFCIPLSYVLLL